MTPSAGIQIGELSKRTGCNIETIRYYERIGLLPVAARSAGRYRIYDAGKIRRLAFIRRAQELGFPLDAVRALLALSDEGSAACAEARQLATSHLAEVRAKIADLRSMERVLADAVRRCATGETPGCPIIDALSDRCSESLWTRDHVTADTTIVAGIEVPSVSPLFLTVVVIHVVLGIACVITGLIAMLSEKRRGRHPIFGRIYYWCLSAVFATATILAAVRWTEDYHLFILGAFSFGAASLARTARRQRWRSWFKLHITGMGLSYIFLVTAFYVDNGHSLPLWRELSPITYWLLPGVLGIPLIVRALLRHPLARHSTHHGLQVR
jgi:DNA-binding transcriptional MerR regulator/uncharacterized membrane protein HdeD (DUF308 family)